MSIEILEKNRCCGCGACIEKCPKKCIKYIIDDEGFYYPRIDNERCINCSLCEKVCPVINNTSNVEKLKETYIAFANDDNLKKESSSGGIFGILAERVLENNGIVYGAKFDNELNLHHVRIDRKDELRDILKSKYVQSDITDIYMYILKDLKEGRKVLFCGTPCQVAAMKKVIDSQKLLNNILLIDFICHGVPSPGVWKSYIKYLENQLKGKIKSVNFRDKKNGWHDFSFGIKYDNKDFIESHEINAYMRSFLSDKNIRPSCYNCSIRPDNYQSDITLGDAWKIEKEKIEWADNRGTSLIVIRTLKGKKIFEDFKSEITFEESDYNRWCSYNPALCERTKENSNRTEFFENFRLQSNFDFWTKSNKVSLKIRFKYMLKRIAKFLKLDKALRRIK